MINLFEGPKPINTPDEAEKWEKRRSKGFFRWRLSVGLLFAPFVCVWGSVWFFLRETVFSDALRDDWVIGLVIQNFAYFFMGLCIGYYAARRMWEDREKHYQAYLKNNKLKMSK